MQVNNRLNKAVLFVLGAVLKDGDFIPGQLNIGDPGNGLSFVQVFEVIQLKSVVFGKHTIDH